MTDDAVESENGGAFDRDISEASYGKHEGKKGRSGPGEVVGEVVSNEAAMMLVVNAFELLSETESTCIDVVCCDTAESLPPQLPGIEDGFTFDDTIARLEPSEDGELKDGRLVDGGLRYRGVEDGGSKGGGVLDGEVKLDFVDSRESGKKSSKRRRRLKWLRCGFKRLFSSCFP